MGTDLEICFKDSDGNGITAQTDVFQADYFPDAAMKLDQFKSFVSDIEKSNYSIIRGFEIDVEKIPKNIKKIIIYERWA